MQIKALTSFTTTAVTGGTMTADLVTTVKSKPVKTPT